MTRLQVNSRKSHPSAQLEQQAASSLRDGRAPRHNDVFIAVMGTPGSGKSSFIQLCSGKLVKAHDSLSSGNQGVAVYAYEQSPDRTIYLIDTPSFDDINQNDTVVLRDIASWVNDYYSNNIQLTGIIYLHRIGEVRTLDSTQRNVAMFRKLSGDDALKKVTLVTTGWDDVLEAEATTREQQLQDAEELWGYMMKRGSTIRRHYNTELTARSIVNELAATSGTVTLKIQDEMVNQNRDLNQTSVGQELYNDYTRRIERMEQDRRNLQISQPKLHEERIRKLGPRLAQQRGADATGLKLQEESKFKLQDEKEELEWQRQREVEKERESQRQKQEERQQPQPEVTQPVYRSAPPPPYESTIDFGPQISVSGGSGGRSGGVIVSSNSGFSMSEYTPPQVMTFSKD